MANNEPFSGAREEDGASLDELLEMLSDARRRRILTLLADRDQIELDEVVRATADSEDPTIRRTTLYHSHLPKLDGAGFVDWDADAGLVRRGPKFEAVAPVVELLRSRVHDLSLEWA